MDRPGSPTERSRIAMRFLILQLLFTAVICTVVLSRPVDPRGVILLVGVAGVDVIYVIHRVTLFRRGG